MSEDEDSSRAVHALSWDSKGPYLDHRASLHAVMWLEDRVGRKKEKDVPKLV